MKKLYYLSFIVLSLFMACEPMEDINEEIDAQANPVVGKSEYTLTEDDYETLDLGYGSFNSDDEAKELIPSLLAEMYPYWGEGSSVTVTYNLYVGSAEGVDELTNATVYDLTTEDYLNTGSDAPGFYPEVDANEEIVDVLATNFPNAEEGDVILATYDHYTEVPTVGLATVAQYEFSAGFLADFTTESITGDEVWEEGSYGGAEYALISGYDGAAFSNEDWLISPEIDLDGNINAAIQINQAVNYASDLSLLEVYITKDFDGTVAGSTWEEIDFQTIPAGNSWDFVLSEEYDISDYDGETINIAFRYQSTTSEAASWEINDVYVKATGITGEYDDKGTYFTFDGTSWEQTEDTYYLSSVDYDSMGAPGQYNNFSSSAPADNYVPALLEQMYPYAQEEDQMFVIYKYYSSSAGETQTRGDLYTYMNGMWIGHETTQETTLQFGHDGDTWIPDNTIYYTLTANDYQLIGDALESTYSSPVSSMLNYSNFDRRESNSAFWSDDMIYEALAIVLNEIAPTAEEGQKYQITIAVYNGTNTTEDFKLIKSNGEWVKNP